MTGCARCKKLSKKIRLQLGALVILSGLVYIGLQSSHNFSSYFVTVNKYRADFSQLKNKMLRVQGTMDSQSVRYSASTSTLLFTLSSHGQALPVVYHGPMPNERFKNARAIVEGKMGSHGDFVARKLMIQCPNHYVPAKNAPGAS